MVELSFTPSPLANDTCHHFYYNGCEQVPNDLNLYYQYVFNFTSTLVDFFGPEEVATWYFEVRCATSHTPHRTPCAYTHKNRTTCCPLAATRHAHRRHRKIISDESATRATPTASTPTPLSLLTTDHALRKLTLGVPRHVPARLPGV